MKTHGPLLLAVLFFGCTESKVEYQTVFIGNYCRGTPWNPPQTVRLNILPQGCPGSENLLDDHKHIDLTSIVQEGESFRIRSPNLDSLEVGSSENLDAWECYPDPWHVGLPCRTLSANVQITRIDSSSVEGYYQLYEQGKKTGNRVRFSGTKCFAAASSCETN